LIVDGGPAGLPGMATCLFVASGLDFAVDDYLRRSPFQPQTVFRKGTVPRLDPNQTPRPDSGFAVVVADDREPTMELQHGMALEFLSRHKKELQHLQRIGVDNMLFDFGVERGHALQRSDYIHPELIQAMARLGMGLIISTVLIPKG